MITHDFPLDKVLELVWVCNHVLVGLDLLVGLDNAQVHPGQVNLSRVFLLTVSDKREVGAKVLSSLLDVVLGAGLVVQQTEL